MLFKYTGISKDGKKVKSQIEAKDEQEAKSKLKAQNIIYTSLQEDSFNISLFSNIKIKRKLNSSILSDISRDLSIYLKSGISLVNSIKLIANRYKNSKKVYLFLDVVNSYLQEGKGFYTALEEQKVYDLPTFYKQSIKVSETSGLLDSVLEELSIFLKDQEQIKKQTVSAIVYPSFMLIVSIFVVGFMLSFVVPKITSIFQQFDQELPAITSFVINAGDFMQSYFSLMVLVLVLLFALFIFTLKKYPKVKFAYDKFLLKLPLFKTISLYSELSRFAYMNSILISSGVPTVQAFKLSSNILKNSVIKEVFINATNKVVEGESLSKMLEQSKTYKIETSFIQAIAIGEQTSQLHSVLKNLAKVYNESNKNKISILLSLLEPILMLLVGSIIGFIVIAMLLPIFSMSIA
ncbi:MAG: type II secretion system F family protein [Campylobacterota bacterium]